MGVRGGFWDELRVVSKRKSLDWLHGKRLAVDLSYWVVQQQTAVGGLVRKPHLRILLFRVVNLISRVIANTITFHFFSVTKVIYYKWMMRLVA